SQPGREGAAPIMSGIERLLGEKREVDAAAAGVDQAELGRGGAAEVDNAAAVERPAVVDSHDHRLAAARHAHLAAERQGAVGGGVSRGIEALAVGGFPPGELAAVP